MWSLFAVSVFAMFHFGQNIKIDIINGEECDHYFSFGFMSNVARNFFDVSHPLLNVFKLCFFVFFFQSDTKPFADKDMLSRRGHRTTGASRRTDTVEQNDKIIIFLQLLCNRISRVWRVGFVNLRRIWARPSDIHM